MKVTVGGIYTLYSQRANKQKYHICISIDKIFLYVNSPKNQTYLGDFEIDCGELPMLAPTPSGKSIISCNLPMRFTSEELRIGRATKIGQVNNDLLHSLREYVRTLDTLPPETQDEIIEGITEWLGI